MGRRNQQADIPATESDVLIAEAPEYPIFDRGEMILKLADVKPGSRPSFGTRNSTSPSMEKSIVWTFIGGTFDASGKFVPSFVTWANQPVRVSFEVQTGMNMASGKSSGRKILDGLTDRDFTREELANLNLLKLPQTLDPFVKCFVNIETSDDGTERNRLLLETMVRISEGPLDVSGCWIKS